jgi:hypothetical protein
MLAALLLSGILAAPLGSAGLFLPVKRRARTAGRWPAALGCRWTWGWRGPRWSASSPARRRFCAPQDRRACQVVASAAGELGGVDVGSARRSGDRRRADQGHPAERSAYIKPPPGAGAKSGRPSPGHQFSDGIGHPVPIAEFRTGHPVGNHLASKVAWPTPRRQPSPHRPRPLPSRPVRLRRQQPPSRRPPRPQPRPQGDAGVTRQRAADKYRLAWAHPAATQCIL